MFIIDYVYAIKSQFIFKYFLGIHCVEVSLTTYDYGDENSWTLAHCSSDESYGNYQEYSNQCCLTPGTYTLECKDSYGDGWHGGYIKVDGVKYCESYNDGSVMTSEIIIGSK